MKVIIVDTTTSGRVEVAVADRDVLVHANVLEHSEAVNSFYIDGLGAKNQQALYGVRGYTKWVSPISQ